jgi:LacI family transcriptional regulator
MALALSGLAINGNEVVDSPTFSPQDGAEMTQALIEQMPDIDAIIYGDDYLALGGLKMLEEIGRKVPKDIAIIGCHNYSITEFTKPTLTTMHLRMAKMGAIAAYRLISMMEHDEKNIMDVIVPGSLVVRESA